VPVLQLEKFKRACSEAEKTVALPTAREIEAKVEELKHHKEHVYTEEEISAMIKRKKQVNPHLSI